MEIKIVKDKNEGGKVAFEILRQSIEEDGAKVLGLATGSTPETLYENMVESGMDFSDITSVNLDEYVGLDGDHPQSYRYFMDDHLFSKTTFKETYVPDGTKDEEDAIATYDQIIEDNPIDLQILGIGHNGHIAFNEPGTPFDATTHKVALTEETIQANKRFFDKAEDVPRFAYTMGNGSIMKGKKIILIAYGEGKADAIKATVEGPVTEEVPASVLQNHDNCVVIVDEAAASKLSK